MESSEAEKERTAGPGATRNVPADQHRGRRASSASRSGSPSERRKTSYFKFTKKFKTRLHFYFLYFFLNETLCFGVRAAMVYYAFKYFDKPIRQGNLEIYSFACLGSLFGCVYGFLADSYTGKYAFLFFGNLLVLPVPLSQLVISYTGVSAGNYSVLINFSFILAMLTGVLQALMIEQLDLNDPDVKTTFPIFLFFYTTIKFGARFLSHENSLMCSRVESGSIISGAIYTAIALFNIVFTFLIRSMLNKESIYFNIVIKHFGCICFALKQKCLRRPVSQPDWLLYAAPNYKSFMILITRQALNVFYVLLATLGFFILTFSLIGVWWHQKFELLFDHPIYVHPINLYNIYILLLLPLIVFFIIPSVKTFNIEVTFLRCLGTSYALLIIAALLTYGMEITIEHNLKHLPNAKYGELRIYNAMPNQTTVSAKHFTANIQPYEVFTLKDIPVEDTKPHKFLVKYPDKEIMEVLNVTAGKSRSYFIARQGIVDIEKYDPTPIRRKLTHNICFMAFYKILLKSNCTLEINGTDKYSLQLFTISKLGFAEFKEGHYSLTLMKSGNLSLQKIEFECGRAGVYAIVIFGEEKLKYFTIVPHVVHTAWLMMPQVITLAFATGLWYYAFLGFLITETPAKMRAWIFSLAALIENAGAPWIIIQTSILEYGALYSLLDVVFSIVFAFLFIYAATTYHSGLNNGGTITE